MKSAILILALPVILLISVSCRGGKKAENSQDQAAVAPKTTVGNAEPAQRTDIPGEETYRKNCLACHQADGSGVPGMYPPLNHAEKIMGPPEGVIKVILFGLKGPSVINGQTYKQQMPPQKHLNDSTIAVLVNYVKQKWGDGASEVTAKDVKRIRAAGDH